MVPGHHKVLLIEYLFNTHLLGIYYVPAAIFDIGVEKGKKRPLARLVAFTGQDRPSDDYSINAKLR